MPALSNPKHERFAQELAKGKSAEESYALAGFSPNRGNASVLKHKQNILDRVTEILDEREAIHAQATAEAIKSTASSHCLAQSARKSEPEGDVSTHSCSPVSAP